MSHLVSPEVEPEAPRAAAALSEPHESPDRGARSLRRRLAPALGIAVMGLFWIWNLIFLAIVGLGLAPFVLPALLVGTWQGVVPPVFALYAVVLILIPVLAMILGATRLRSDPERLFMLGYGVEAPAMVLAAISLFVVREMTTATAFLFVAAGLGQAALLWQIVDRRIDERGLAAALARAFGLSLMAMIGVYATLILAFYALPLPTYLDDFFASVGSLLLDMVRNPSSLTALPYLLVGGGMLLFSATLFALLPLAMPYIYLRTWWRGTRALARHLPIRTALLFQATLLLILGVLFAQTLRQPQTDAFELLRTPPSTPSQAQALRDREPLLRDGLRNAYLAPLRYVSSAGDVTHIRDYYRGGFGLTDDQARGVQHLYETLLQPFLYAPMDPAAPAAPAPVRGLTGALATEPERAAALYRAYFDEPILQGERQAVVQAVRSTWDASLAAQARREVEDHEIHLASQELTVHEHGDWADLELYEVYQNQTSQRQEVVYFFNLPESAVVTGVWLGNSPDRASRAEYRVSPRGAAQALYRAEVQRRVDPALVEQVGPRQYRLRVFPIEPPQISWSSRSLVELNPTPSLHMWLTWRVLAGQDGWALPQLSEKRNVFWDQSTTRMVNGHSSAMDPQQWLPATLPTMSPTTRVARQVRFPNGETVIARPGSPSDVPTAPAGLRLAVVLDRSRSMGRHADQARATLERLRSLASSAAVDVYLTSSPYRGEAASRIPLSQLDSSTLDYFGGQQGNELLGQFEALRAGESYDAVLVVTDGMGFELGASPTRLPVFGFPIWMVHVANELPLGYDDATLAAIQSSGGGVVSSVNEMWTRFLVARGGSGSAAASARSDLVDGYLWTTVPANGPVPSGDSTVVAPTDGFAAFAARHLILDAMYRQRASLDSLANLDQLHAIATEQSIVTPYSSMIVLVNSDQQRRLDELEKAGDRFDREGEAAGETVPGSVTNVTAVPEPHEWLLLGLGVMMLGWYARKRRNSPGCPSLAA